MSTFPQHRISNSDDIRSGNAAAPNRSVLGVPLAGNIDGRLRGPGVVLLALGAPAAADPDGICAQQTEGAAGDLDIDGALASGGAVTLDVPRAVVVDAAGAATAVVTVYGTDEFGQSMRENITLNGTTAVNGKKAFKTISRVAVDAAATDVFVGTNTILGLPLRPAVGGFLGGILNENTADAGTYVAPLRTTSTATSADVRGTYTPAGSLDGTNVYAVRVAIENGPADADAFGIAQFNG